MVLSFDPAFSELATQGTLNLSRYPEALQSEVQRESSGLGAHPPFLSTLRTQEPHSSSLQLPSKTLAPCMPVFQSDSQNLETRTQLSPRPI